MAQPQIATVKMEAQHGAYKQFSGTAITTTQAMVPIQQMKVDSTQHPLNAAHVEALGSSIETEGICRGEDIHAYINTRHLAWGNHMQEQVILLFNELDALNKTLGDGNVEITILPNDIPLRIVNGNHCLHAFCRYFVDHWSEISLLKPPLVSVPMECPFANDLGRPPAEVFAQVDACWIAKIEYIGSNSNYHH